MRLFLRLRLFQRVIGSDEIPAGILAIFVQKQIIQFARQIIMMRHVCLRFSRGVELFHPSQHDLGRVLRPAPPNLAPTAFGIGDDQRQKSVQIITVDCHRPINIALAQRQISVAHDACSQCRVHDPHCHLGCGAVTVALRCAVWKMDDQRAAPDQLRDHCFKNCVPHIFNLLAGAKLGLGT